MNERLPSADWRLPALAVELTQFFFQILSQVRNYVNLISE